MGQMFKDKLSNGHMLIWVIWWICVYRIQGGFTFTRGYFCTYRNQALTCTQTGRFENICVEWHADKWGTAVIRIGSQQGFTVILTFSLVLSLKRREEKRRQSKHYSPSHHWFLWWI